MVAIHPERVARSQPAGRDAVQRYDAARTEAALARIDALAKLMDSAIVVPGTQVRLGLDAVIGLVPVLGDLVSQAISTYIIWQARELGVSRLTLARMIANTALDTVVGAVPVLGDAFDVAYRANLRNLALLRRDLERRGLGGAGASRGPVIDGTATRL